MKNALMIAGFGAFCVGVNWFAHWSHNLHCEGARTGKCGWAWCEHYDGSDYLHDFNF